jgi:hypothetical protein
MYDSRKMLPPNKERIGFNPIIHIKRHFSRIPFACFRSVSLVNTSCGTRFNTSGSISSKGYPAVCPFCLPRFLGFRERAFSVLAWSG